MNPIVAIFLATLLIGLSKGGLGGPVPVALVTPLLSQVMPAAEAVGIVLPLLIFADMFALRAYWRQWDIHQVKLLLPTAILGVVMGSLLLVSLADQDILLRRILGVFTLSVVIYKVSSDRLKTIAYQHRNWHGYFVGWLSGLGSALANVGAPPFTAYMMLQKVSPTIFIGTTTVLFAIVNLLKLPGALLVVSVEQVVSILWALPLIPPSIWIGRRFVEWVRPQLFEKIMLFLLFGASLFLLLVPPR